MGVRPEKRPLESIYLECINTKWTDRTLTDEEIEHIATRWRQFGILRDLYGDQSMRREFESYRAHFASHLNVDARAVIFEASVTQPGSFCLQLAPNPLAYSEFKARFYKSLCLHSIATSSRIFARVAIQVDQLLSDSHPLNLVGNTIAEPAFNAWTKDMIVVGGEQIKPSQNDRLWSLEVFDFLYLFLLKKAIPLTKLDSWIDPQLNQWRCNDPDKRSLEETIDLWDPFIIESRCILQPSDIIDLIQDKSWSTRSGCPRDKDLYMRLNGLFPVDDVIFHAVRRSDIVDSLHPGTYSLLSWEKELPTWWDKVRANSGSPFAPGFRSRYLAELAKIGGMDVQIQAMEDEPESSSSD